MVFDVALNSALPGYLYSFPSLLVGCVFYGVAPRKVQYLTVNAAVGASPA